LNKERRRIIPAIPSNAVPSNATLAGSGVAVFSLLACKEELLLPEPA
jgi:hypothetical protein